MSPAGRRCVLRGRDARRVNGDKRVWVAASFVNFVGPLAYFAFGRGAARSGLAGGRPCAADAGAATFAVAPEPPRTAGERRRRRQDGVRRATGGVPWPRPAAQAGRLGAGRRSSGRVVGRWPAAGQAGSVHTMRPPEPRSEMPKVPDVSAIVESVKARIKQIEGELAQHQRLSEELERLREALGKLEGAARSRVGGRLDGGRPAAGAKRARPSGAPPQRAAQRGRSAEQPKARAHPPPRRGARTRRRCSRRSRTGR